MKKIYSFEVKDGRVNNPNEITFVFDEHCEVCKRGIGKLVELNKNHPNAYGSKNLKTRRLVGKLELVPDYNSSGILTHWHIR